jgi:hypothetical protein
MKQLPFAQAVALLANLGIVASIVFLALQMRESGNQARVNVNQELVGQVSNWERAVAADEELAIIFSRGLSNFTGLSEIEKVRFDLLMISRLRLFSSVLLSTELRISEPSPDGPLLGQVREMINQQGFREWWSSADHSRMSPRIVDLVESLRVASDATE